MAKSTAKPPDGLGPPGRALWRKVSADVADGWRLDARDEHLLRGACRAADVIAALERAVKRDGEVVKGSKGQTRLHPALTEARMQRDLQAKLLAKVELEPPAQKTGHLSGRQRDQLANARKARWGKA